MPDRTVTARIRADVQGFVSGLAKASAATEGLTGRLAKVQTGAGGMAAQMVAGAVGAASLGAALVAPVKAAADFDSAVSRVRATGAVTGAQLEALKGQAMSMATTFGVSGTQAMGAVEALAKAGVQASDIMGGGLQGALALAAAGEMDVGQAAETASSAMTQFGLSGKDVGHVADVLSNGANMAQGDVKDLAMALSQGGMVASQMGMSLDQTVGALAEFANAGLMGSDAGTSLKTMLQKLAAPSKQASELMDQLGIHVYDAQGHFVGLDGIAGQLQGAMKGLSEEQRNAALATIFGSDAVRAASILYKDGAGKAKEWASSVGQSGAAMHTASTNMDNLNGDIAKMRAAWTNTMVALGEGSQGPLRGLVQNLTELAGVVGRNQGTVTALAGIAGDVVGLGASIIGIAKVITAIRSLATAASAVRSGISTMAQAITAASAAAEAGDTKFARFSARVGGLKGAAMLAGAGIVLTAAAFQGAQQAIDGFALSADQARKALDGLASGRAATITASMDQINASFRMSADGVNDLASGLNYLNNKSGWHSFADGLNKVMNGLMGTKSNTQELTERFSALDAQLVKMRPDERAKAWNALDAQLKQSGLSAAQMVEHMPQLYSQLQEQAKALGVTSLSAKDYSDWIGGKVPAAVAKAEAAQNRAGQAGKTAADGMKSQVDVAGQLAQAYDDVTKALTSYASAQLKLSGSQVGMYQGIADATKALKENGRTLDLNTEKGRNNQKALNDLASSILTYQQNLMTGGASADQAAAKTAAASQKFIALAQSMGMPASKARELAQSLGLIPSQKSSELNFNIKGATPAQIADLRDKIKTLPKSQQIQILAIARQQGITQAISYVHELGKLADKTNGKQVTVNSSAPGATQATKQLRDLKGSWTEINGRVVFIPTSAPGAVGAKAQLDDVHGSWQRMYGKTVFVPTAAPGAMGARAQIDSLNAAAARTNGKHVEVTAHASTGAAESALTYVARDRSMTIRANVITVGGGKAAMRAVANADGNLYERHDAQIAPAGAWRIWAEPETGGEAYIPLAPSKRERSTRIWRETGRRLGITHYADGGISPYRATATITRDIPTTFVLEVPGLASAVNAKVLDVQRTTARNLARSSA